MHTTLKAQDTHNLERKSSISQHKDMLAVYKDGEWCPLVFDVIDSVKCGVISSHKAALTDKPVLGYTFPVGTCKYVSDLYMMAYEDTTKLEKLPSYYGSGFYQKRVRENVFINADNGALGIHDERCLRVGKDYVVARNRLEPNKKS